MKTPTQIVRSAIALVAVCCPLRASHGDQSIASKDKPQLAPVTFSYSDTPGIGLQPGVCRRDPSDVLRVGDTYYVYYTKVVRQAPTAGSRKSYPSGYSGTIWYASSNDRGNTWTEEGEALGVGASEAFDSFGVFTPNILSHDGQYYLYYTGVCPTPSRDDGVFENNSTNDRTALSVAVADDPRGPFVRVSEAPILQVSDGPEQFDSYRIDDACLLVRDGKVWLYYKGRSQKHGSAGPLHTQMGLACADTPVGPFVRQNMGQPVQDSGHEVLIWGADDGAGVMSLVSAVGPNGRTLQFAPDGRTFRVIQRNLKDVPHAPGLYRPELTDPAATVPAAESRWGISMVHGRDPYLRRFEMHARPGRP